MRLAASQTRSLPNAKRVSSHLFALSAAITLSATFTLWWFAALIGGDRLPHGPVELFTTSSIGSGYALLEGLVWTWVTGSFAGLVAALAFNLLAGWTHR